jgi:hypothetical protein
MNLSAHNLFATTCTTQKAKRTTKRTRANRGRNGPR